MRAVFSLTPSESKRLIARGVVQLPEVIRAKVQGRLIVCPGTTCAFVAEELLGSEINKGAAAVGIVTNGRACLTEASTRIGPFVWEKGELSSRGWTEVLEDFEAEDVFIKGANAIDSEGNVGVLMINPTGGFIARGLGYAKSRGAHLIMPVGLEKLIPSVTIAARFGAGFLNTDLACGRRVGFMPVIGASVVTELTALKTLFNVEAALIGAGGVGGSEGAQIIALKGEEEAVKKAMRAVIKIKGEQAIAAVKEPCLECQAPCNFPEK